MIIAAQAEAEAPPEPEPEAGLTIDPAVLRAFSLDLDADASSRGTGSSSTSISSPLTSGKINTTVIVRNPDLLLQRLALPLHAAWSGEYRRIQTALEKRGVGIPRLVPPNKAEAVDGDGGGGGDDGGREEDDAAFVTDSSGAVWRAFELFPHVPPSNAHSVDAAACGGLLARTHAALADGCDWRPEYEIPVPNFHDADHFVRKLEEGGDGLPSAEGRHMAKDLAAVFERLPPFPEDDAPQIIHGDPKLANMLFSPAAAGGEGEGCGGGAVPHALIDWETYMWGSVWIDLGDLLRSLAKTSFVSRGSVDRDQLSGVIEGYRSVSSRGLSPDDFERAAYASARRICVELAARYLLDSDGELFSWDPASYPSAHAHNLERAGELRHVLRCLDPAPLCLVDYDRTLFRTDDFRRDLFAQVGERLGKGLGELERAAKGLRTHARLGGFDFRAWVRGLDPSADVDEHEREMRALLRDGGETYLYDDAVRFTHGLIARGLRPTILTYGDRRFQLDKVLPFVDALGCGNDCVVPVVVVEEPKGEYVARHFPGRRGFLVDDKVGQELPEGFTEVWLNRVNERRAEDSRVRTARDLDEALEVVASLDLKD